MRVLAAVPVDENSQGPLGALLSLGDTTQVQGNSSTSDSWVTAL